MLERLTELEPIPPVPTRSIVALYPTLVQAEQAEAALRAAGVPARDIALSAQVAAFGEVGAAASRPRAGRAEPHEKRYFEWLVGADIDEPRILRYRDLLDGGAGLVCVRVADAGAEEARTILRGCGPLDLGAPPEGAAFAGAKPGSGGRVPFDEYVVGR
jgi:hypothetical protein